MVPIWVCGTEKFIAARPGFSFSLFLVFDFLQVIDFSPSTSLKFI